MEDSSTGSADEVRRPLTRRVRFLRGLPSTVDNGSSFVDCCVSSMALWLTRPVSRPREVAEVRLRRRFRWVVEGSASADNAKDSSIATLAFLLLLSSFIGSSCTDDSMLAFTSTAWDRLVRFLRRRRGVGVKDKEGSSVGAMVGTGSTAVAILLETPQKRTAVTTLLLKHASSRTRAVIRGVQRLGFVVVGWRQACGPFTMSARFPRFDAPSCLSSSLLGARKGRSTTPMAATSKG